MTEKDLPSCIHELKKYDTIRYQSEEIPVEEVLRGMVIAKGSGFDGFPPVKKGVAVVHIPEENAVYEGWEEEIDLKDGEIYVGETVNWNTAIKAMRICPAVIGEHGGLLEHLAIMLREDAKITYIRAENAATKLQTGDTIYVTKYGAVYRETE